ncbi:defensin-like protein CAL1 [Phragmites australis]|uniref:defensin-like protein CAL1 n=1 Tax=Phragmites australis TaxID=29695 RepID=UPI002D77E2A3|nr:defensin-like protein CAL1 [Phragmites australis]
MAPSRRMAAPALFFLLLLVATEMGTARVVAEERHCLSQSHRFKGLCVSSSNCANVCMTENFPGGECKIQGGTRKCFCKVVC